MAQDLSRKDFLRTWAQYTALLAQPTLAQMFMGCHKKAQRHENEAQKGGYDKDDYGPLRHAGAHFKLPEHFRYIVLRETGDMMTDGIKTPAAPDGTGLYVDASGLIHLLINHELEKPGLAAHEALAYDKTATGCVTHMVFDPEKEQLVRSNLVLCGTASNCNGGITPWGSWLTCEETTEEAPYESPHGYVFEVPFHAEQIIKAVPIKAMGRFVHEAAVVDPATGIVYMTEDNGTPGDGFYRYVPHIKEKLLEGGVLQMLAIDQHPQWDTTSGQTVGKALEAIWVTIDDPDPKDAVSRPESVYLQGYHKGGARFLGLEGAFFAQGAVYFTASESGDKGLGQIWSYKPTDQDRGILTLLYESADRSVLDQPDAITISPNGSVVVGEDGDGESTHGGTNLIRVLSPQGRIFDFAECIYPLDLFAYDAENKEGSFGVSEISGICFSPDRRWMFAHIQYPGITVAITGPFHAGCL